MKKSVFRIISTVAIVLSVLISSLPVVSFLVSIHFNVRGYVLYNILNFDESQKFNNFNAEKNNFHILIKHIDDIVNSSDSFFDEYYEDICYEKNQFYCSKNSQPQYFEIEDNDLENINSCLSSFPSDGFGVIRLKKYFSEYVFFPDTSNDKPTYRFIVYTRGEMPQELIDLCWRQFEYVEVKKLADGWYDIVPSEKKRLPGPNPEWFYLPY